MFVSIALEHSSVVFVKLSFHPLSIKLLVRIFTWLLRNYLICSFVLNGCCRTYTVIDRVDGILEICQTNNELFFPLLECNLRYQIELLKVLHLLMWQIKTRLRPLLWLTITLLSLPVSLHLLDMLRLLMVDIEQLVSNQRVFLEYGTHLRVN